MERNGGAHSMHGRLGKKDKRLWHVCNGANLYAINCPASASKLMPERGCTITGFYINKYIYTNTQHTLNGQIIIEAQITK